MKTMGIVLIFGFLFLAGLSLFSRKLLYFPVSLARTRLDYIRENFGYVKEISVPADDGKVLHGWILEKDMENLPHVLYFGGNAEEVSLNIEEYAEQLNANVFLINYRGYGKSTGTPSEDLLKADALVVYDFLADRFGLDPQKTVAWGRSLGSSMACYLSLQRNLAGLILTCPFDSIEGVAAFHYPGWLVRLVLRDRHRTTDFSDRIRSSTLVLAAGEDEVIPFESTQRLFDSLTCEKQLKVIDRAGHNTISGFEPYFKTVNRFLNELY